MIYESEYGMQRKIPLIAVEPQILGEITVPSHLTIQTINLPWNRDHKQLRPVRASEASMGSMLMKVYLAGLIVFAGGLQLAAAVDPDPDFRIFSYTIGGGVLGVFVAASTFPAKSFKELAQEAVGNLSVAVAFGPSLAPWLAARFSTDPNFQFYMAVSAVLGITGIAFVKAVRSEFVARVLDYYGFKKSADASK